MERQIDFDDKYKKYVISRSNKIYKNTETRLSKEKKKIFSI